MWKYILQCREGTNHADYCRLTELKKDRWEIRKAVAAWIYRAHYQKRRIPIEKKIVPDICSGVYLSLAEYQSVQVYRRLHENGHRTTIRRTTGEE